MEMNEKVLPRAEEVICQVVSVVAVERAAYFSAITKGDSTKMTIEKFF